MWSGEKGMPVLFGPFADVTKKKIHRDIGWNFK